MSTHDADANISKVTPPSASETAVPPAVERDGAPTQDGVPPTPAERLRLRSAVRQYVRSVRPTPPLPLHHLERHCEQIIRTAGTDPKYMGFVAVLTNNELWSEMLAGVAYDRRLLLLPQCLRDPPNCKASFDAYGLVCAHCGSCRLDALQREAERLGYVVLAAEGLPVVTSLVQGGRIDAMIGVCCLDSLQKVFPFVEAAAIPAMAVPLLRDGCEDTDVDMDWVWDAIYLSSDGRNRPLQVEAQRRRVESWFTSEALAEVMGSPDGETERIAREWLERAGKRWRPFLTVCACETLCEEGDPPPPEALRCVAVAVECFHKASLIHDDIEDGDPTRYGDRTLHERYGLPVAINVGDFLLGEGYRLLAAAPAAAPVRAAMLRAAAEGHRELCIGQGAELCWMRRGGPLSPDEVIDIFTGKTAPAFEVALPLGALLAGAGPAIRMVLREYSEALGVAYQIRDDLSEMDGEGGLAAMRPSLLVALGWARASEGDRRTLGALWSRERSDASPERIRRIILDLKADEAASEMLETHRRRAVEALQPLQSVHLKALLRRVLGKIFNEFETES